MLDITLLWVVQLPPGTQQQLQSYTLIQGEGHPALLSLLKLKSAEKVEIVCQSWGGANSQSH